jgi:hypothetical protein
MKKANALLVVGKRPTITRSDLDGYRELLVASARQTQTVIAKLATTEDPITFLAKLKFERSGCDPLDVNTPLNLIEQLNQAFTYLASFEGAALLFSRHPEAHSLRLNLGTSPGFDIESEDAGGIAAEVFSAVTPQNNGKLAKDVQKVSKSPARHRYAFFMSPEHPQAGQYSTRSGSNEVCVWSLGYPPVLQDMRSPC